ncbi:MULTISPECIES: MFS transporter [Brevibacillus]|uniref:MFS transporter n=1 Tax=Brevibacillus TaxID=55080 RepID=UPI000EF00DF6|nr:MULTISPECIES: MFS transporter [Brevibacillus]MDH6350456.1 MFS family permease [Brevibacillus sp. 1238]NRQ55676.1 MFS transporter [Brevibacillus sp. HD1.4A]WDV94411.1 MFS transporter [Brevibacillus parabrevis]HBZ81320.1 MFS transporter [Brevibacillus sp.]
MNTSAVANSKNKYLVLGLLCLGWIINYFDKVAINVAVIPISQEFGLTETQVGLILSSFFLSYAIMQPIGGSLADKFGSRKVILVSVVVWSLFTILTGTAWSFLSLIVIRFLFGIGEGSYPSASSVAVAESFSQHERARAKSILTSATTIGSVLATLVAASLSQHFGWQIMFVILGVLGLFLALLYAKFLHPTKAAESMATTKKDKLPLRSLLKISMLWKLMAIYFGISMVTWGMMSWMPSYMVKVRHLDMVSMGALAAIPAVLSFVTVLITGWLLDKRMVGREKLLIVIGSFIGIIALYLLSKAPTVALVVFYQAIANIGLAAAVTTTLTMPLKYIDASSVGAASGLIYLGGQLAGVIAPTAMGFMIQQFNGSYDAAFWLLIIAVAIPFFIGMTIRTVPPATSEPASSVPVGN